MNQRPPMPTSPYAQEECKRNKVSAEELKSGNKRRTVSATRQAIAQRSQTELGLSCAEIARHLGVNTSSINRALLREAENSDKW